MIIDPRDDAASIARDAAALLDSIQTWINRNTPRTPVEYAKHGRAYNVLAAFYSISTSSKERPMPLSTEAETTVDALKRRILFLEDTLKQFTQVVPPMDPLERALMDIANATDGQGRKIALFKSTIIPGSPTLRNEVRRLMKMVGDNSVFIGDLDSNDREGAARRGEAAYYRNLALLATACSIAIETGR